MAEDEAGAAGEEQEQEQEQQQELEEEQQTGSSDAAAADLPAPGRSAAVAALPGLREALLSEAREYISSTKVLRRTHGKMKTGPIKEFRPVQVFNRLQGGNSGNILIVDTREQGFDERHVVGAINVPPPFGPLAEQSWTLEMVVGSHPDEDVKQRFIARPGVVEVVLCGPSSTSEEHSAEWEWSQKLANTLQQEGQVALVAVVPAGSEAVLASYAFLAESGSGDDDDGEDEDEFMDDDDIDGGASVGSAESKQKKKTGLDARRENLRQVLQKYPSEVLDSFMFLGNIKHATNSKILNDLGITHVIDASNRPAAEPEEDASVQICHIRENDTEETDLLQHFPRVIRFIKDACGGDEALPECAVKFPAADRVEQSEATVDPEGRPVRVLVHCSKGVSRSATLAIFAVMVLMGMRLVDSAALITGRRDQSSPNHGFRLQLMASEVELFGKSSVRSGGSLEPKTGGCALL